MATFKDLDEFLRESLRSLEAIQGMQPKTSNSSASTSKRFVRTHTVSTRESKSYCVLCGGAHEDINKRRELVGSEMICFTWMGTNHVSRFCRSRINCQKCNRRHTMLHENEMQVEQRSNDSRQPNLFTPTQRNLSSNMCLFEAQNTTRNALLPTAWVAVTAENGKTINLRALIDQGSEASLIARNAVQRLGVDGEATNIGVTGVAGMLAGKTYGCVQLQVSAIGKREQSIRLNAIIIRGASSRRNRQSKWTGSPRNNFWVNGE